MLPIVGSIDFGNHVNNIVFVHDAANIYEMRRLKRSPSDITLRYHSNPIFVTGQFIARQGSLNQTVSKGISSEIKFHKGMQFLL